MDTLLYYKEAKDGQILEEGITEAGSMSSFIAAGTRLRDARHQHDPVLHLLLDVRLPARRRPDLGRRRHAHARASCSAAPPAARRSPAKACSTRTATATLLALPVPNCLSYDPAFAYELAVIIEDGIRRMYSEQRERLLLPHRDERAVRDAADAGRRARGHPEGDVPVASRRRKPKAKLRAQLLGSGAILNEVLKAQEILEEKYDVGADVWSVTSYSELYRDGHACERWNLLHPGETPRVPYVTQCLGGRAGRLRGGVRLREGAARRDRSLAAAAAARRSAPTASAAARAARRCATSSRWTRGSSSLATLAALAQEGQIDAKVVQQAIKDLGIDPRSRIRRSRRTWIPRCRANAGSVA